MKILEDIMERLITVEVLGDSILKGVQLDPVTGKYRVDNHIDEAGLARRWGLKITNHSRFGCTAAKASKLLDRMLKRGLTCDVLVMDFGGNDCDFKWKEIAARPEEDHPPAFSLKKFLDIYRAMVRKLKEHGVLPVLTTLPPLEPKRFLDWWCRGADEDTVIRWMGGSICNVYAHQELYSHAVAQLAREESVPLVDIRKKFLEYGHLNETICEDGTHPNFAGQALITAAFDDFLSRNQPAC